MQNFWLSDLAEDIVCYVLSILKVKGNLSTSSILSVRQKFPTIEHTVLADACGIATATYKAEQQNKSVGNWWFTKDTFEQSTAPLIAEHHASRFNGCDTIVEVCTGSGTDTYFLAKKANNVVTFEVDLFTFEIAERNFKRNVISNVSLINSQAEEFLLKPPFSPDGIWADPARRNKNTRVFSPEDYSPPFSTLLNIGANKVYGVKVSPAFNDSDIPEGWTKEIIGYKNECREIVLWKGLCLPNGTVHIPDLGLQWFPKTNDDAPLLSTNEACYIVEPHPTLIRSGYLGSYYKENNMSVFDRQIAYGISAEKPQNSDWYKIFRVIECFRYNEKLLQEKIRDLGWSRETEIKKRGFFTEPDNLRKKIRWVKSEKKGVIITTRHNDDYIVFLADRC